MANPEHVEIVGRGKDAIADWVHLNPDKQLDVNAADLSESDLRDANLSGANLSHANLRKADLSGANLNGANLAGAILDDATVVSSDLSNTNLSNASLLGANFSDSSLDIAVLNGADLRHANLSDASLIAADLRRATLTGTNLSRASLYRLRMDSWRFDWIWRTNFWFKLDRTHIRNTRFDASSCDPYSILRRAYTGPKLMFVFFFTVIALLPLIGHAVFWSSVSKTEARLVPIAVGAVERTAEILKDEDDKQTQDWVNRANEIVRRMKASPLMQGEWSGRIDELQQLLEVIGQGRDIIQQRRQRYVEDAAVLADLDAAASWTDQAHALLAVVAPDGGVKMRERRVWQLLVGVEQGATRSLLAIVLLLYNFARAGLTYCMSSLRDNEERTGDSPALKQYWWLWRMHQVAAILLYVSLISGVWRVGEMLFSVVLVPA